MSFWPPDVTVFALAAPTIKQFEGFRASPYLDDKGIPSIGYGTIQYSDGSAVAMSDPAITETTATLYLLQQAGQKARAIAAMLRRPATVNQAAAMLSLTYNIGTRGFRTSTVLREFNAGNIAAAADAFRLWDKETIDGHLVESHGLHDRREAERGLFLKKD